MKSNFRNCLNDLCYASYLIFKHISHASWVGCENEIVSRIQINLFALTNTLSYAIVRTSYFPTILLTVLCDFLH